MKVIKFRKVNSIFSKRFSVYQYTVAKSQDDIEELALLEAIVNYDGYLELNSESTFADWYNICYENWHNLTAKDFKRYKKCLARELSILFSKSPANQAEELLHSLKEWAESMRRSA